LWRGCCGVRWRLSATRTPRSFFLFFFFSMRWVSNARTRFRRRLPVLNQVHLSRAVPWSRCSIPLFLPPPSPNFFILRPCVNREPPPSAAPAPRPPRPSGRVEWPERKTSSKTRYSISCYSLPQCCASFQDQVSLDPTDPSSRDSLPNCKIFQQQYDRSRPSSCNYALTQPSVRNPPRTPARPYQAPFLAGASKKRCLVRKGSPTAPHERAAPSRQSPSPVMHNRSSRHVWLYPPRPVPRRPFSPISLPTAILIVPKSPLTRPFWPFEFSPALLRPIRRATDPHKEDPSPDVPAPSNALFLLVTLSGLREGRSFHPV